MERTTSRPASFAALPLSLVLGSVAHGGPVVIVGDSAETHASVAAYAGLLQAVAANVTNGQVGILALGVDTDTPAAEFLVDVAGQLDPPQSVAFVNGETLSAIGFSGYGVLYVPSDAGSVEGGITQSENDALALRQTDIAVFLGAGGGLLGLTQGDLENPYAYLSAFTAVASLSVSGGACGEGELFDDVSTTPTGELFGITDSNLDGCCWRGTFTSFPEALTVLATVNEPGCPSINGQAAVLGGFVQIGFDDPSVFEAAGEPNVEALGDLDGDGTVDVGLTIPDATAGLPGRAQVFLNQGVDQDGAWLGLVANPAFGVGVSPSSLDVGLFDGDQALDLAVTNAGDGTVWVFLNDDDGTAGFTLHAVIAVGGSPSAVVAQDFTEDGLVDLAVALEADQTVVVLLGDGNGNFTAVAGPGGFGGFGFGPVALFGGDFDGNKCPDLSGAGSSSALGGGGTVFVAFGQGTGQFDEPVFYPVGAQPVDIAVGDIDKDGFPDIATANVSDDTISVLINAGDGSFLPAVPIGVGQQPTSVALVDLDNDLDPDLAVAADDPELGPAVRVLVNLQGTGLAGGPNFQAPQSFSAGADPNFVVGDDMDGDGLIDLVTVNEDQAPSGGSVSVLLNSPSTINENEGLVAAFDVKPGGCPNPLNPNSNGVLPTALVGTSTFDVNDVDLASLLLARADGVGGAVAPIGAGEVSSSPALDLLPLLIGGHATPVTGANGPQFEDVATPFPGEPCDCHDLEGDGILDVKLKFATEDLAAVLELGDVPGGTPVELLLTGALTDGTGFMASDCVLIVPPAAPPGLLTVHGDPAGAFVDATPADDLLDEGGFLPFARSYPQGTTVSLTAPPATPGHLFVGWSVPDNSRLAFGGGGTTFVTEPTIEVTITGPSTAVHAVYLQLIGF